MNTATHKRMKLTPKLLEVGKKIMCACDDPQCYKTIEVSIDSLIVYEDVSDAHGEIFIIDLPDGVALVKYEKPKDDTSFDDSAGEIPF